MRDLAVLALADDLSGAAETAAALMSSALRADLALDPGAMVSAYNAQNGAEARALVVDLDTRQSDAERAGAALAHVLAQRGPTGPRVLVKIDSLLRGNVAATLSAVGPAVLAPALPVGGRTVVAGAVRVNGAPLRETTAWGTEPGSAPDSIAQVLAPAPCRSVSLSEIRRDPRSAIAESLAAGRIPVCDSETDSDLDAVVAATPPEVALVGSGGLAAALGRSFRQRKAAPRPEFAPREDRALLVVVGTAEPGASVQVHRLVEAGARSLDLHVDQLAHGDPLPGEIERIADAVRQQPTALRLHAPRGVDPAQSRALVRRLAGTVRRVVTAVEDVDLVLTGGETARKVLDALGVRALRPVAQVHHGAVLSRTADGRSVVTRPGSFGDPDSLVRILRHLRPDFPSLPTTSPPVADQPTTSLPTTAPGLVPGSTEG
ncbi:4-hydroxythreonine-4-phosphate dehydrogenase [Saccharopolyspora erythraea NRRL 2338]|uniref:4-hydroxythreonine-4-phosphate dehydrogenase n=2 Tax=Saccharopolyspora erythraea TaxID=1836 RepID=A4FIE3_SACEN|nr:four-carbon acid sugar kinase family protein [Saccharopolyspora erythraea]EQD87923.1 4-hydroxythreonine-4-phosphate dehydrogenase [Saccharopolyspora erythraea D]PFG97494.1 4-hydroxythreonine-4-phosphate dehydrogenase [Saccharopolyspora erythraea NRRL 2338]QRK87670.1 four-carbon acid sugar kinase family protein [Saccharopolyspora erythraea]CAM03818.1 4-hydroxythreonine-4-phosphate dehydrogenase [Saccharopolyspora erythraea NRRL 2338]